MPTLRPFRDYDEKDVINLFAYSGAVPLNKGTLVKIAVGFRNDLDTLEMLGSYGDFAVSNVVAQRYGALPKVVVADTGSNPVGMTLFDIRELDENNIPLKYNLRKAAEMEAVLSGQAVPVVTRGTFLYSGAVGSVTAGSDAYAGSAGQISATGTFKVGKFLGPTGADGSCLVWLNIA
jgi:hypothetical protein